MAAYGFDNKRNDELNVVCAKTKLCLFFKQGICRRGRSCTFAHSDAELRPCPNLKRTRLCANIFNGGKCERGKKCKFAHSEAQLRMLAPGQSASYETVPRAQRARAARAATTDSSSSSSQSQQQRQQSRQQPSSSKDGKEDRSQPNALPSLTEGDQRIGMQASFSTAPQPMDAFDEMLQAVLRQCGMDDNGHSGPLMNQQGYFAVSEESMAQHGGWFPQPAAASAATMPNRVAGMTDPAYIGLGLDSPWCAPPMPRDDTRHMWPWYGVGGGDVATAAMGEQQHQQPSPWLPHTGYSAAARPPGDMLGWPPPPTHHATPAESVPTEAWMEQPAAGQFPGMMTTQPAPPWLLQA